MISGGIPAAGNPDAPDNPPWIVVVLFIAFVVLAVAASFWFTWWRDEGYWRRRR